MRAALKLYLAVVVAIGGLIAAHSVTRLASAPHLVDWAVLAVSAILVGNRMIRVSAVEASVSVSDTFFIAAALLFGSAPATVALAANSFAFSWRKRHDWPHVAFNTVAPALSMWVAARAFFLMSGMRPLSAAPAPLGSVLLPLLCLTTIYFVLNSGLTAIAVGLQTGQSPVDVWWTHFLWLSSGYLASASMALCLVLVVQQVGALAVAVILPVVAVFHRTLRVSYGRLEDTTRHLAQVDRLYQSTVETLAMAIDAKDDVTHSHVRRVQTYAAALARALRIADEPTLKAIEAAALLHDTGKLAVPERILNKPGRLSPAEFEQMKEHVDIGANILALVDFPFPVVPIVRCHHENWDGSGYPRGLAGDAIPIGARILSVVDCFDALTSDRPYRRRLSIDEALAILAERRGRMYDPAVVDAFVEIQSRIEMPEDGAAAHCEVFGRIAQSLRGEEAAAPLEADAVHAAAGHDAAALAFVSLARLAAGTAGAGDVLALASSLLEQMAPGASGAWFVPRADDRLSPAETFGPAAERLRDLAIDIGDRLTGWVAANRQMILNSDAALDLGARASEAGLTSCLAVPLSVGESLAGVLTLYAGAPGFSEAQGRIAQMVAPHVAQAILATARSETAGRPARDFRLVASR
jgi:putative nucleotidyltransferase with HDIG domain